jgi:two-component system, cell cycle response regulator
MAVEAGEHTPCILIVDDSEDNVELLRARLEAWGFRTASATDGAKAIEAVLQTPPDLILLDVMMPNVDGMEVARRIKGNSALPFIPIIMQTALDSIENKIEGLDAGADDYITKPINFAELRARVRSLLRIKALQEKLERRERELAEMNERLLRISQTDGLTGLLNRRHLEERLREMFEHSTRLNEPLGCVMLDIDHFKSVNDTHGHQAGDAILRQFADILTDVARDIDRVGRYGGEEFMILLPASSLEDAVSFAERVRRAVEERTFTFEGGEVKRTLSAGVSAWPHPQVRDCDTLIRAADDALYVAKERGRNRVTPFDGIEFNKHTQDDDARHLRDEHGARAGG